jgi:hypothetical protein
MPSTHDEIETLSKAVPGERTTVFVLEHGGAKGESVNQIFGIPPGVDDSRWPLTLSGAPMVHILTLDLRTAPGVGSTPARAIAFFLADPDTNDALFEPVPAFMKVLYLSEEDIAKGVIAKDSPAKTTASPRPYPYEAHSFAVAIPFTCTRVEVPSAIFGMWGLPEEPSEELQEVASAVGSRLPGFAGGRPTSDDATHMHPNGKFVMQFNESLVPINLGDAGTMFVFDDVAFFTSH